PPARSLLEPDGFDAEPLAAPDIGQRARHERQPSRPDPQGGRSDSPTAGMTEVNDVAVSYVDPGVHPVDEAGAVVGEVLLDVRQAVRRGVVVMGDRQVER